MDRRHTLNMPNAKRSKISNGTPSQLNTPSQLRSHTAASLPSPLVSIIKRRSRTDAHKFLKSNYNTKFHHSGHILSTSGKDLFIWSLQTHDFTHFEVPVANNEPCLVTLVSPMKDGNNWSVLAVSPNGAYRYWRSIQSSENDYAQSFISIDDQSQFVKLESHPTKKGAVVLSTDRNHSFLLTCGGEEPVVVESLVREDVSTSSSESFLSWFSWGSKETTTKEKKEEELDLVKEIRFSSDFVYFLTERKIVRYYLPNKEFDSETPILNSIKEALFTQSEEDIPIWLLDFTCQRRGAKDHLNVLVAYEEENKISHLIFPIDVDSSAEASYETGDVIMLKHSYPASQNMDLNACIFESFDNIFVVWQDMILALQGEEKTQRVQEVPTSKVLCAGIFKDQLYYVVENGRVLCMAPVSSTVLQDRLDDSLMATEKLPTENIQSEAKLLLRQLHIKLRQQTLSARNSVNQNIQELTSGASVVEASQQIIDASPAAAYRWASSLSKENDVVNDANPKIPALILEELQKKYRQHMALIDLLNTSVNKNGHNLWRGVMSQEQKQQVTGHGEMLKFAIHLRLLQNKLIAEKKKYSKNQSDVEQKIKILTLAMIEVCENIRKQELHNPENFYTEVSKVYQIFTALLESIEMKGEGEHFNTEFYTIRSHNSISIPLVNSVYQTLIESVREYHAETAPFFNTQEFPLSTSLVTEHKRDFTSGNPVLYSQLRQQIDITSRLLTSQRRLRSEPVELEDQLIEQLYSMIDFLLEVLPNLQYLEQRTVLMPLMQQASIPKTIQLAEKYLDFSTLKQLLAQGPQLSKKNKQTLDFYMQKFQDHGFPLQVFQYFVDKGWNQALLSDEYWNKKYHAEIFEAIREKDHLAWIHSIKHLDTDYQKYSAAMLESLERLAIDKDNNLKDKQVRLSMYKLANLTIANESSMVDHDVIDTNTNRANVLLHVASCQAALVEKFSFAPLFERWLRMTSTRGRSMTPMTPDKIMSSVYNEILTGGQCEKLIVNAMSDEEDETKIDELENLLFQRLAIALDVCTTWIENHDLWRDEISDKRTTPHLVKIYHAAMISSVRLRKTFGNEAELLEEEKKEILQSSVFFRVAAKFMGTSAMLTEEIVEELTKKDNYEGSIMQYVEVMWDLLEKTGPATKHQQRSENAIEFY